MAINIDEAIKIILDLEIFTNYEILPIESACNRISAQEIKAQISLPRFNNSAMDGYAILYKNKDEILNVVDTIFAGDDNHRVLENNQAIKIMTGARIPENCTAIVPKENCTEIETKKIKILKDVQEFQHIRYIGEDIQIDETLLSIGDEINFSKITLLASQGVSHIKVYKKPKVNVFASGEELKLHYQYAQDYQIYNSNTPTFISRCEELSCEVTFMGQAKDSIESIKALVENSLDADLIITSGGVSVGDADFTKDAFEQLNYVKLIEGIKIKPGKPTVLGKIGKTYILNLPGNPLAASLIFELFGRLIIQKLLGSNELHHGFILGKLKETLNTRKGKTTILPGYFDGEYFYTEQKRSPGMVSTLSRCNSFIVFDENIEIIKEDSLVKIIPINWKFFSKEKKDFLTHE